jgi:hypothetical protein
MQTTILPSAVQTTDGPYCAILNYRAPCYKNIVFPIPILDLKWAYDHGVIKEPYFLGYKSVLSVENQPTFQRNMLLPSSEVKNKSIKKPAWRSYTQSLLHAGFWLAYSSPLKMRRHAPEKSRLTVNGLHDLMPQKIELHIIRIHQIS